MPPHDHYGDQGKPENWGNLISKLRDGSEAAYEEVCQNYWKPVYDFARKTGYSHETSEDLTQEVFLHCKDPGTWNTADPEKGLLRSFLIGVFRRIASRHHQKETAIKRGGKARIIPIENEMIDRAYSESLQELETPEKVYERSWAQQIFKRAVRRLHLEYEQADKIHLYIALKDRLTGNQNDRYAEISEFLDMSEVALRTETSRMRRRFARILKAEVARTVADSDCINQEVLYILNLMRNGQ